MSTYIKFTTEYESIGSNKQVTGGTNANSLLFWNLGTDTVTIDNKILLQQGQTYAINGNVGEVLGNQTFNIAFANGVGTTKNLLIVKKIYS